MVKRKKVKLVGGWGINDVDYKVYATVVVEGKHKRVWICPYYRDWSDMIKRCFCVKHQDHNPCCKGCTITEEWKYLSNFIAWVDSQPNKDWQNCELDKDILISGNKHYSPDTCVYISAKVNTFIKNRKKLSNNLMTGVSPHRADGINKFIARCNNPFTAEREYMGIFQTEIEAHLAWKAKKHEHACKLADTQDDPRVADALRNYYV